MNIATTVQAPETVIANTRLDAGSHSVGGRERSVNQDSVYYYVGQSASGQPAGLFIVCDGLGGHQNGELASKQAIATLSRELQSLFTEAGAVPNIELTQPAAGTLEDSVRTAVIAANQAVMVTAQTEEGEGSRPGTTVTLALVYNGALLVANVGDSRTYVCRGNMMYQITRDHSLANKLAEAGVIGSPEEAGQRNVIYRALGIEDAVEVDIFQWPFEPGDRLLLCSDGLWKPFADMRELAQLVSASNDAASLSRHLVSEAVQRDGSDDTSAVVAILQAAQPSNNNTPRKSSNGQGAKKRTNKRS